MNALSQADPPRKKIAFWFRYGPAEHAELFHAIPEIVKRLAREYEVHYYGLKSCKPLPPDLAAHASIHHLPFTVDRTSYRDRLLKTLLWILCLPFVGLHGRFKGIRVVYIDETVPLTALLARWFSGSRVAFSVVDFFPEIYWGQNLLLRPLVRLIRLLDLSAWRRIPLIFTRAYATKDYLVREGVPPHRIHPVYDPCDFEVYHPSDRTQARHAFGYADDQIVLVHHGILHPNKGNDRILHAMAATTDELPALRYLLVGDGPEMGRLKALAQELRLADRVCFAGWLPRHEDVNRALNAGDIGLVMRVGMKGDDFHATGALVHNLACGLPVLCARLGGTSEIVRNEVEGLLFDPNDTEELKRQLRRLYADSRLRRRCGEAALARAQELFSIERVTRQTTEPLIALLDRIA